MMLTSMVGTWAVLTGPLLTVLTGTPGLATTTGDKDRRITLLTKHSSVHSLKKTVMKMRPQVNGPIDVGYGNYILTAPADRQGRKRRKKKKSKGVVNNDIEDAEEFADNIQERDSNMKRESKVVSRQGKLLKNGKYDVPELLSTANTLTNPNNSKVANYNSEL